MYDSLPGALSSVASSRLMSQQAITIAGHAWTLRVRAMPGFDGELLGRPRLVAWTGVLASVALALAAWLLAASRARAQAALARSSELTGQMEQGQASVLAMAEAAQRSQAMLRSILDSTIDGILVDNINGHIFTSNRRFRDLWQVPDALDWQADGAALVRHVESQLEQAAPFLGAAPMRRTATANGATCCTCAMAGWSSNMCAACSWAMSKRACGLSAISASAARWNGASIRGGKCWKCWPRARRWNGCWKAWC